MLISIPSGIFYIYSRKNKTNRYLENIAQKYNGTVDTKSFSFPRLTFSYHDEKIEIYSLRGTRYSSPTTHIQTKFICGTEYYIHVFPESVPAKIVKKLDIKDIQIGNYMFDKMYCVQGNDDFFVHKLLSFSLQHKFLGYKKEKPEVTFEHDLLHIMIPMMPKSEETYEKLIDLSCSVIDNIRLRGAR